MNLPKQLYNQVGMSTITLGGLQTILSARGSNLDHMILTGQEIGITSYQYVPLRGHTIKTLQQSGIITNIQTMESAWGGVVGRVLCGNPNIALQNNLFIAKENPSIISIDFAQDSAIEIAGCGVELYHEDRLKDTMERSITEGKRMVLDNFHARDLTSLGRKKVMQGMIPGKQEVEKNLQSIFDKKPHIVCVHIQERDPEEIKNFLMNGDTLLEHEISIIKQSLGDTYNQIPVIIELDPIPLAPISSSLSWDTINFMIRQKKNSDVLKRFVYKVNKLRYAK